MKDTNTNKANTNTPATIADKVTEILKPYTRPRSLLKEWTKESTGADFDELQDDAKNELQYYFKDSFLFTAGSRPRSGNWFGVYEVGDLFGLPYTSSGCDFAAIWNTNTQAQTRAKLAPLFFCGIAIEAKPAHALKFIKNYNFIYIFTDNIENYFYFTAPEFLKAFEKIKEVERAANLSQFIKDINKITPQAVEVLKKYNGKKCGEKTREKIREEINAITEATAPAVRLWLDYSQYSPAFRFNYSYNTFTKNIYYNFYNCELNTIQTPEENPAPLAEFDPITALNTLNEAAAEVTKEAAAMLEKLNAYNAAASLLQLETITTTAAPVSSLAKYGLK